MRETIEIFTGYSMVVLLCLDICLGLFPEFRILAFITQFYTLKIVWDGAAVMMKINEERRLIYTMVVAIILIAMPFVGLAQIMIKGKADLDDYVYKAEEISFYFLDKFY